MALKFDYGIQLSVGLIHFSKYCLRPMLATFHPSVVILRGGG